jgi:hypothetical protein
MLNHNFHSITEEMDYLGRETGVIPGGGAKKADGLVLRSIALQAKSKYLKIDSILSRIMPVVPF